MSRAQRRKEVWYQRRAEAAAREHHKECIGANMLIRCESINHYLAWIQAGQRFAFVGYSDAEWNCVLGNRLGEATALGQTMDAGHGQKLLDVLRRRQADPWFLFAVPKCLYQMPGFAEGQIDWFLGQQGIKLEAYERDTVTDDLAREANLYPFIRQLYDMKVVLIGNHALGQIRKYDRLAHWAFVGANSPNLHLEPGGIDSAVARAKRAVSNGCVVLLSAGVSAAIIADKLWDGSFWIFDCGSMWDGFAGIGAQREWRSELYQSKKAWQRWINWNLEGKPRSR